MTRLASKPVEEAKARTDEAMLQWASAAVTSGTSAHGRWDVIDMFSGCGGLSYGFHKLAERTGVFQVVGAVDTDEHANATYAKNLGLPPAEVDLSTATPESLERLFLPNGRNNPLIVIGGPPCQGFSSHRKKDSRKDHRNSLVGRFAEIAVGLDPDLIVMENVPDLLGRRHSNHFEEWTRILESAQYRITVGIVNMAGFGVPQERFRAVAMAAKGYWPTLPNPPLEHEAYRTVRDAIGSLEPLDSGKTSPTDPMHKTSKHRQTTIDVLKQVPKDGGSRPVGVGPECLDKVKGFYDVYGRLYWDRPAITITARCRTPSCGRFVHPEQDRGLSVREAALLQSFPAGWSFEGPFDDLFKQIGNAVPPRFSIALAEHCAALLSGERRSKVGASTIEPNQFSSYSSVIAQEKRRRSVA